MVFNIAFRYVILFAINIKKIWMINVMNEKEKRFEIFGQMLRGERPDRLPMDIIGYIEYRKDFYHLGEPEYTVKKGEVGVSSDGTRRYTKDGGVWYTGAKEIYKTYEDVLNVDLSIFPIEPVDIRMLSVMQGMYDKMAKSKVPVPWHYGTLLSRAEIQFGWEPLLECSAYEPEAFGQILDHFGQASVNVADGWSRIKGVELLVIHDDLASTKGPIWSPTWLRAYAFPWYKKIFDKIHENGRKVLYITDGNYAPVIDDILALGPDGLYCESTSISPAFVTSKGGRDRFYLLKTDSRNIDIGTEEDIRKELTMLRGLHQDYHRIWSYSGGGGINPKNEEAFRRLYRELLVYEA